VLFVLARAVDELAEQWGLPTKVVGSLIYNMRTHPAIYRELRMEYEDAEIPHWVKRPDQPSQEEDKETQLKHEETPGIQERPTEQQGIQTFQAPTSRKSLSIGDRARVLAASDPRRRRGAEKGDLVLDEDVNGFSENDLYYLASLNITRAQDGSGGWMRVTERTDGSVFLEPVDPHRVLRQRDLYEQSSEIRDTSGISQLTMEALQTALAMVCYSSYLLEGQMSTIICVITSSSRVSRRSNSPW
jgi:hypothetical protein